MTDLKTLHNEAMDLAYLGDRKKNNGLLDEAVLLYHQAYEKERDSAYLAERLNNPEPGLYILFRSAASLALQCEEYREAERLISHALSGNPSPSIAQELRQLLQQVYAASSLLPDTDEEVSYELRVPKAETNLFYTIIKRMGWSVSALKATIGKVAVL